MEFSALASVEIKILSGFLLTVSLLLFGGTYTYRTSVELADSVEWVAHTQEVRATLANLYGSLAGAELSQRDYLLTAQQVRLDEYAHLAKVVQDHLAELSRLTGDNPTQQRDWAALKSLCRTVWTKWRAPSPPTSAMACRPHGRCLAKAVSAAEPRTFASSPNEWTPSKRGCWRRGKRQPPTSVAPR